MIAARYTLNSTVPPHVTRLDEASGLREHPTESSGEPP